MTPYLLNTLNKQLEHALGTNPHGEPLYRWRHTSEIFILLNTRGAVENIRKMDEDRWVIEMWMPPRMSARDWENQFGHIAPYPRRGEYEITDIILGDGIEPTERVTQAVVGKVKAWRNATEEQIRDLRLERAAYAASHGSKLSAEIYRNQLPAFGNVFPGCRGNHVSFGGI